MKENNELKIEDTLDQGRSQYYSTQLPTGLLLDKEVYKTVLIREMTGHEEDLLGTISAKNSTQIMSSVIERCVMQIGPMSQEDPNWRIYIKSLVESDRMFLLIHIRIASLGKEYSYRVKCPSCGVASNQVVNLLDFKIEGLADPEKRDWSGVLPSGKKYRCEIATSTKEVVNVDPMKDSLTYAIMQRLVELDGEKPLLGAVKGLSMRDRKSLRQEIRYHEGEIDNTVEMTCPSCQHEFSSDISIAETGFFFPSEI